MRWSAAWTTLAAFVLLVAVSEPASGSQAAKGRSAAPPLAGRFVDFLTLTTYIMTDKERDVFNALTNDRDRDLFVEAFWKIRDPTPATPQNERREEIVKRFQEANRKFSFRSTREGWKTDQGRIYIILGPPMSTAYIAGDTELCPTEIWSYYGDPSKGMPVHFELVFYQWKGVGEFKLYDPFADGPQRLLIRPQEYSPSDYQGMYEKILDRQPDLARVVLSIIPGEIPYGFQPSLETPIYMAAILESPKKGVDETYAAHFLNYKGVVSTEYLTNYMNSEGTAAVILDPLTGLAFCDFGLRPDRLSVDFYEPTNTYSSHFVIDVSLRKGETIVYQYSKEFPVTFAQERLPETEATGIAITDSFPVIEGRYGLTVLLRNTIGREFSVFETTIDVPAAGATRILDPVLGHGSTEAPPTSHQPFQGLGRKISIDPRRTFATGDEIVILFNVVGLSADAWKSGSVSLMVKGSKPSDPFEKAFVVPLTAQPFRPVQSFTHTIRAAELPPDYYTLDLFLKDGGGRILGTSKATFIISPQKTLSHPSVAAKAFSLANIFAYHYILAQQYDQSGMTTQAEAAYKKAFDLNPGYAPKVPDYASFLLKTGRPGEALSVIERIRDETGLRYQYLLIRGRALLALSRYAEALVSLQDGNRIYNSDTVLLNALGTCYFRLGQKDDALRALRASLSLNPKQPEIEKLVREIESK